LPEPDCYPRLVELVLEKVFSKSQPDAPETPAFYDLHMKYVVEPGEFEIMAGNSPCDHDRKKAILTVT
jgi:hypothetical protein